MGFLVVNRWERLARGSPESQINDREWIGVPEHSVLANPNAELGVLSASAAAQQDHVTQMKRGAVHLRGESK